MVIVLVKNESDEIVLAPQWGCARTLFRGVSSTGTLPSHFAPLSGLVRHMVKVGLKLCACRLVSVLLGIQSLNCGFNTGTTIGG